MQLIQSLSDDSIGNSKKKSSILEKLGQPRKKEKKKKDSVPWWLSEEESDDGGKFTVLQCFGHRGSGWFFLILHVRPFQISD